ncbi:MAG: homoserine O-acetyltransferase, partial [Nitrospinae bacterium]|nr:homoserine O-acetyltransferase [Nitrospinota bacterium]
MNRKNSPQDPGSVGLTKTEIITLSEPFKTDSGEILPEIQVAYETYGELSPSADNAVLVIHALTGDAHAAGFHNWWDPMIGPGKAIDTRNYFVVSSNNLGGCSGTTGPASINPATGRAYNTAFPVTTVEDTVRVQKLLLDHLGVKRLKTVIGGSLAGMQTLEWGLRYSDFCDSVIPVAGAARLDPMGIAWDKIARRAITADGEWKDGDYAAGEGPRKGLSAARMLAHITYLSRGIMWEKFGREIRDKDKMLDDIAS